MCTTITCRTAIQGSAKGPDGWFAVDTATVYFDHPFHAPLDHSLNIDFVNEASGAPTRVAVEISAASARELVQQIAAVLDSGEAAVPLAEMESKPEPATPLALASGVIGSNGKAEDGAQAGT